MEHEMFNDSEICDTIQVGRKKVSNKKEARQNSRKTLQQMLSLLMTIAGIAQVDQTTSKPKKSIKDRAAKKKHWKTKRSNARDAKANQTDESNKGVDSTFADEWEDTYDDFPETPFDWLLHEYDSRPKDFFAAKETLEWILPQITEDDYRLWDEYMGSPVDYDSYYYVSIPQWICAVTIGRNQYKTFDEHVEMPTKEKVFSDLNAILTNQRINEMIQ